MAKIAFQIKDKMKKINFAAVEQHQVEVRK